MDPNKLPIELTPYDAVIIWNVLNEIARQSVDNPKFGFINNAIQAYEQQVCTAITDDQILEVKASENVRKLVRDTII